MGLNVLVLKVWCVQVFTRNCVPGLLNPVSCSRMTGWPSISGLADVSGCM